MGSSKQIPCFALLMCAALLYLLNFLSTHKFSHFHSSDSLPIPLRGVSERLCGAELLARLNHDDF